MQSPLISVPCPSCGLSLYAKVFHDPGVRTFNNGDPGYPETTEVEWDTLCACGESILDRLDELVIAKWDDMMAREWDKQYDNSWPSEPEY